MINNTKIIANDVESINLLSTLLQDSITCRLWIIYTQKQLKLLVNRICIHEAQNRLLSIITIDEIISVKITKLKNKIEFFTLLSLNCEKNEIRIHFSNGLLLAKVNNLHLRLKDVTHSWSTNTTSSYYKNNKKP